MTLKYIASVVVILCTVAIAFIPWKFCYDLAKKGFIKYAILSFMCAISIPVVFLYLAGNPSDWLLM